MTTTAHSSKRVLYVDGDVVAFRAAAAAQAYVEDQFGWIRPMANTKIGEALVENALWNIKDRLKGDIAEIALTDPKDNWRKTVDPAYKTNRTGERPLLLDYLKDYLRQEHGAWHWSGLEADDVLGILMTAPEGELSDDLDLPPVEQRLCVGNDKDFLSIPGRHWTVDDYKPNGKPNIRSVTLWEANRFHLIQTLAGDRVDGYYGCPGVGMARAASIIDERQLLAPTHGVKTRGVNKGDSVIRWVAEPSLDYWAIITSHYRKAGLGEQEALKSARLARILRYGEYDPLSEELTLWTPDKIQKGQEP